MDEYAFIRIYASTIHKVLTLCLVLGLWLPSTNAGANLIASKTILNDYMVEGKDLTIKYSIYNVGTRYNVHCIYTCCWMNSILIH